MQQYLPFTVLKPYYHFRHFYYTILVATVLTVYGIETITLYIIYKNTSTVATVLTVYGIETTFIIFNLMLYILRVATVLTVYGIETANLQQ